MRTVLLLLCGVLSVVTISGCVSTDGKSAFGLYANKTASQSPVQDETDPDIVHPVAEIAETLDNIIVETPQSELPKAIKPTNDLWQYIAQNLDTLAIDKQQIQSQIDWYAKHPNYMKRISQRAKFFLYYIVQELEANNMPLELALLPIVESSFDPFAYSHGSAAGMWQFIPGTGKRFGMQQTWWYDGRRDIIASTQGAIDYLQYLHKFFDGNWEHALAAYNSGEGRVRNAIRKNKRSGKATDFWSLKLPKETQGYVPKLMALVVLLKEAETYQMVWPHIPNQPMIDVVEIDGQVDLAKAAELAGLSVNELHALNPGFNRWATDPKGPHRLVLPIDRTERFTREFAALSESDKVQWVRHKVQPGESLGVLAQKYATTVHVIKDINSLKSNVIIAGKHLLVPRSLTSLENYGLSQTQRTARLQNRKKADVNIKHVIQSGDTLWDLAQQYKVSTREIASWNGLSPKDYLKPGQTLVIWYEADKPVGIQRKVTYTVRRGDSLAQIGQKFNVKIAQIKQWNNLFGQKYLQPGQKLTLIVDVTRTGAI